MILFPNQCEAYVKNFNAAFTQPLRKYWDISSFICTRNVRKHFCFRSSILVLIFFFSLTRVFCCLLNSKKRSLSEFHYSQLQANSRLFLVNAPPNYSNLALLLNPHSLKISLVLKLNYTFCTLRQ